MQYNNLCLHKPPIIVFNREKCLFNIAYPIYFLNFLRTQYHTSEITRRITLCLMPPIRIIRTSNNTSNSSRFFISSGICLLYVLPVTCFTSLQHSCSSTQSWGSVLPSIVETRDQNSRGCPILFSHRNLGSFCVQGTEILYTHSLWEVADHSGSKMHYTCLNIIHDPAMRPGVESNRGCCISG